MNNLLIANPAASFAQGVQTGNNILAQRQERADNNLLRQIGPGLVSGDPAALQQLAGVDPMAAMQITRQRQQDEAAAAQRARQNGMADRRMGMEQERLQMAREAGERQAVLFAKQMDAATLERERAETESNLAQVMTAADANEWDQIARSIGEDDYVGRFEDRDMIVAGVQGLSETLKSMAPPKPADEYGRYVQEEQAAGREPLPRIQFKRAGQKTTQTRVTPEGGVEIVEGFGDQARLPKTTEGEKSAAGYLSRMKAAESKLTELAVDGETTRSMTSLIVGGTNFEGLALSNEQSKILQAQRDWVRAKLRKESGAVIGADEMAEEVRTYFPLPGEGPEIVAQKRQARMQAERQFEIMSGNAASQAKPVGSAPDGPNPYLGMTEADLIDLDIMAMTPEQQKQALEALSQ